MLQCKWYGLKGGKLTRIKHCLYGLVRKEHLCNKPENMLIFFFKINDHIQVTVKKYTNM